MPKMHENCSLTIAFQEEMARETGQGRPLCRKELAEQIGVHWKSVYNATKGHVSLGLFAKLIRHLPPHSQSRILAKIGIDATPIDAEPATLEEIGIETSAYVADHMVAAGDGHLDHNEKIRLRDRIQAMVPKFQGFLKALRHNSAEAGS